MMKNWFSQNFSGPALNANLLMVSVIFCLNFLGDPSLKYVFLLYTGFVIVTVALLELRTSLFIILSFCFLEGQGRILWNYHPFFRIAFDLVLGLALVRTILDQKKFTTITALPQLPLFFVLFHFLWYVVQFFNPNSIGFIAPLAATKIYVFPFLVFLMFRNNRELFGEEQLPKLGLAVLWLLILECVLSLYQLQVKEPLLLSLSPFYQSAMKGSVFTAESFRPFGTTFLPGAVSVYLFLCTGFIFLRKKITPVFLGFLLLVGGLIFVTLLGSQVRSATLKFVIIFIGSLWALLVTAEGPIQRKASALFKFSVAIFAVVALGVTVSGNYPSIKIIQGLERWQSIKSYEDFKSKRAGPVMALKIVALRLSEAPLGIGPGLTGAASSVSKDLMDRDPIYDRDTFWGYDNFFLSLVVEFGYGAIFYFLLVLSIPVLLFTRFVQLYRQGRLYPARVALLSFFQVAVVLLGNWGAIGLPYNPESFFFWFWAALGLNIYDLSLTKPTA